MFVYRTEIVRKAKLHHHVIGLAITTTPSLTGLDSQRPPVAMKIFNLQPRALWYHTSEHLGAATLLDRYRDGIL
jgi:hypothetical protein